MNVGMVYLVGAGPGDPGLITMRGVECLRQADLVLYDGLVNPLLLRHTNGATERTARTRRGGPHVPQSDVNERMIAAAREGKTVVRLKGGDPFIFGRGGEETAALAHAGIPFEVVPGITAATAAAVCSGISLTHRDFASAVTFVTGHEEPKKGESAVDDGALVRMSGTLVFYMGLDRIEQISARLIAAGKPKDTPAAVVCQATLPTQRLVVGTLEDIAKRAREAALRAPTLIIVGEVVAARQSADWFTNRPLFGLSIGVARADDQLEPVIERIVQRGGEPVAMPLIQIGPPPDWEELDAAIEALPRYDWLVLTSVNGVRGFFRRLHAHGGDARRLAACRIAVIGPATAEALLEFGVRADLVPESYRSEGLVESLKSHVAGKRVLWLRADRGRDVLPTGIQSAGGHLDQVVVYTNRDVDALSPDIQQRLDAGRLDWIALSSPSIARGLARVLGSRSKVDPGSGAPVDRPRLAAISPVTAEAAIAAGLTIDTIATDYTWDGLLDAIARSRQGPAVGSHNDLPGL